MKARIAVVLVLGVAATLIVSWGSALLFGFSAPPVRTALVDIPDNLPDGGLRIAEFRSPGATLYMSGTFSTESRIGPPERPLTREECEVPAWCRRHVLHMDPEGPSILFSEARGWPVRALMCETPIERRSEGLHLPWSRRGDTLSNLVPVVLPRSPIWTGILVDSALYAAVCAGVLFGPGVYRVRLRRRRGRCPRCGYDLKHDLAAGCPECGWGRVVEQAQGAEVR